ncbi:MAG: hypothetical protein H0Z35_02565 [Thermoanaerobacteraceae bacterium]|nr:hypothetical protein [Thermoanaerobacteraceae bacterium]
MDVKAYTATAIGSLPYQEPEKALQLIWQYLPDIPHWPQLPQRGNQEHFVYQYLYPLVELDILEQSSNGKMRLNSGSPKWEEQLTWFYSRYLEAEETDDLQVFATPRESAAGFYAFLEDIDSKGTRQAKMLKGQISGPLTVSLYLFDQDGKPAYYQPQMRDVLVKTLTMQARWQARELSARGLPAVIFVDDPGVYAVGSSAFVAVNRQDVIDVFTEMVAEIKKDARMVGVHSCAGVDWSIFTEAGFDIISFDADLYFDSLLVNAADIKKFLEQGGYLAWGGIPTTDKVFTTDKYRLADLWEEQKRKLVKQGISEDLLKQVLVTPSCGAGTLSYEAAERIYALNYDLSGYLQESN